MTTKIVYVLVSNDADLYYEQVLLSVYSFRLYEPQAFVELVVDSNTEATLRGKRSLILQYISKLTSVSVSDKYTNVQKSRFLKTRLREIVEGDFIYIDTDTIICASLGDVDSFNGDICAVLDNHHGEVVDWQVEQSPDALGWKYLAGSTHFCGGVIYAKDSGNAHEFFRQWHENWKHSASFGCNYDQLGLRKTVLESGIRVEELDGIWNCQISRSSSLEYRNRAKVMHYQGASFEIQYLVCCDETLLRIKVEGIIPSDVKEWLSLSQYAFNRRRIIVSNAEYNYMKSPLFSIFQDYPLFFDFLAHLGNFYREMITWCYNLKIKMRCNR